MLAERDLIQWHVRDVRCHRGGRMVVPVEQAPFGRVLPYRRAGGGEPKPGCASLVRPRGWIVDFGQRGTTELLLGLSAVTALREMTPGAELHYSGPEADLMRRCSVPLQSSKHTWGPHVVRTATRSPVRFRIDPDEPPTWLDRIADDQVEVHAALPMRHYLTVEQNLGVRLSRDADPSPVFLSDVEVDPGHVVLVTMPGWPRQLDLRVSDFAEVAAEILNNRGAPCRFTVLTSRNTEVPAMFDDLPADVVCEPSAVDCVDLFASAEVVVGTDVALTQLAALTGRRDGDGPAVVSLYSRHSYLKWCTGSSRQHAVATRFAQALALSDRSAEQSELADANADETVGMRHVPRSTVVDFTADCAGW